MSGGGRSDQLTRDRALLDLTDRVRALEATPTFFGLKQIDSAIYGSGSSGTIPAGNQQLWLDFSALNTNAPDTFKMKGASSPYKAAVAAGFYYWQVELQFSDAPPPFLLPNSTDPTIIDDYGLLLSTPGWNGRGTTPPTDWRTVTPGETVPYVPLDVVFDGFIQLPIPVDDMEVNVALRYVQAGDSAYPDCSLYLARLSNTSLPDESSNIIP